MKRGFTLIEIIVTVVILAIISGGALVYLNNFTSRKNLDKSKDEIVASIKLIQNYAKTRQLPVGSTEPQLNYIRLRMSGNNLQALANNTTGNYYFSTLVNVNGIGVTVTPQPIIFWAGGRLSLDTSLTNTKFYGVNDTAVVNIGNSGQGGGSYKIIINALGQVSEEKYVE